MVNSSRRSKYQILLSCTLNAPDIYIPSPASLIHGYFVDVSLSLCASLWYYRQFILEREMYVRTGV